jgi:hypothetical protein
MLIEFEDMTEINNFDQVRRLKAQEKSNPVQWETNTGIIKNISKKGTADGGKSGIVQPQVLIIDQKQYLDCHRHICQQKHQIKFHKKGVFHNYQQDVLF